MAHESDFYRYKIKSVQVERTIIKIPRKPNAVIAGTSNARYASRLCGNSAMGDWKITFEGMRTGIGRIKRGD